MLKAYWCEIYKQGTTWLFGRNTFRYTTGLTCEIDLDDGMGHTVRAALLTGVTQSGDEEPEIGQYRMDIYDTQGGTLIRENVVVPAEVPAYRAADALGDYSDEELLSDLARRLRQRGRY